jgi:carboxymethylenebutenolidase
MAHMTTDLDGLFPKMDLTRRGFVVTTLATGFALSLQPVSAQTITTDANGLAAGEVKIPVADGQIPAYRAQPATGSGPFPTVIVVEEIVGVHEHIKDICRRFAKLGYLAVAPELYSRPGDITKLTDMDEVIKMANQAPDATTLSDLDATAAWAAKNGGDSRLGITGFCRGGRTVWLYAAHNPNLKAAVAWYGPLGGATSAIMPKNPLDLAAEMKAPVLGLYGGQDQSNPVAQVEEMKAKLKAAGKTAEFVIYPDAPHAFNADYRPSYRADAAKDGMARLLAWFKQYGVA